VNHIKRILILKVTLEEAYNESKRGLNLKNTSQTYRFISWV